ncbi:MAG: ABC transporter ATP-binding protein [Clostridia bacterium]|nr:ABC transporter ATP-binding protein [Clostridia bacterium]MBQ6838941.1 ABC transporter ATP-binding protein [Clostridia bacterium]
MDKTKNFRQILKNMLFEWKWLFGFIIRYKWTLLLYVALGVVGTAMSLGTAVSGKYLIDSVISRDKEVLLGAAAFLLGFSVLQILFQALSSWVTAVVSSKAHNEIRSEIYSHVLKSSVDDIGKFHSGDLLNRLESDVSTISSAVINFIPSVFTRGLQFFGSLLLVLYYDKTMALLALMSAPLMFFSSRILVKTIRKYSKATRELNGKILAYSEESVQNIQIIKAFDITRDYIDKFKQVLENYRQVKLSSDKFSIFMTMILSVVGLVVSYSCYGWGVYRLWQGLITYGTMTLFLQISGSLTSSFGSLAALAPSSISIATAAGRVMEITCFDEESDEDKDKALKILDKCEKSSFELVLENVSFSYEGKEKPILQDVSLTVSSGDTIGLVGPSGEGKTTLFKLILGIIKPTEGRIYIKASDGEEINISDSTRRFCSYVPQHVTAFSGSIKDNLLIVKNTADLKELEDVLKKAELYKYVEELSQGIDTPVSEQGANMSQGQLQRLSIARALLRDARILLMDEATSALDAHTEANVLENIMTNKGSGITMLTTHRESMLAYCDKVYRISDSGRISV